MRDGTWQPLATGEFLLGHVDEAMEYSKTAPSPWLLAHNGTYMVYRKLHENVGTFNRFLEEQSKVLTAARRCWPPNLPAAGVTTAHPLLTHPMMPAKQNGTRNLPKRILLVKKDADGFYLQ